MAIVQSKQLISTDTNSWGMDTIAFVSPYANVDTGAVGFANTDVTDDTTSTAFRTVDEANASTATVIVLLPGFYFNINAANGKTYYAMQGVRINKFRDNGVDFITTRLLGHAEFIGFGIEQTGDNGNFEIECDQMNNVGFICSQAAGTVISFTNTCTIKARSISCNHNHGGGWAVRPGGDSTVEIECNDLTVFYWMVSPRGDGSTFKLKCPNILIRSGGIFGNQYKSFINHQGTTCTNCIYDIDLMGGTLETQNGTTTSFGIADSTLLLWVQSQAGDTSTVKFSNGRVKANNNYGILVLYQNRSGNIELDNIDLSSNINAFSFWNQSLNVAGQEVIITIKDCNFEGGARNRLGNARLVKFFNTNIKVLTGNTEVINFEPSNATSPGTAYFVNCNFELEDAGEILDNFTGVSVGLANCYGSQPLGTTVTDLYSGYTQLTPFELPNLIL